MIIAIFAFLYSLVILLDLLPLMKAKKTKAAWIYAILLALAIAMQISTQNSIYLSDLYTNSK